MSAASNRSRASWRRASATNLLDTSSGNCSICTVVTDRSSPNGCRNHRPQGGSTRTRSRKFREIIYKTHTWADCPPLPCRHRCAASPCHPLNRVMIRTTIMAMTTKPPPTTTAPSTVRSRHWSGVPMRQLAPTRTRRGLGPAFLAAMLGRRLGESPEVVGLRPPRAVATPVPRVAGPVPTIGHRRSVVGGGSCGQACSMTLAQGLWSVGGRGEPHDTGRSVDHHADRYGWGVRWGRDNGASRT